MSGGEKKTSVCLEPQLREFLRAKAVDDGSSISEIVNDALSIFLLNISRIFGILMGASASLTLVTLILFSR